MTRNTLIALIVFFLAVSAAHAMNGFEIEKYEIVIPKDQYVRYGGVYADRFPDGLPIGIGSGLTYVGLNKDGARVFYAIGDRGPNADSPKYEGGGKPSATKMFPVPGYTPSFGAVVVKDGKAELASLIPLRNEQGREISGRPLPDGLTGSTGETPLDDKLAVLPMDRDGLDTEGIAIDRENPRNLWICDEYGPFIAKIDGNTGRIIKKYVPGKDLPAIVAKRQANRGFEGIAVTPSNKVLAAVQSICDVDGKVKESQATLIRLVLLDPATGETRMFAYPHDRDEYKNSQEAKIGDLHALSDTRFIIVERGKGKDGKNRIPVYVMDISGASDITGVTAPDGRELETLADRAEVEKLGVKYVAKEELFDLAEMGWKPAKAEGVALLPDHRTLAVTSDNDFGFTFKVTNPATDENGKPVTKVSAYTVDSSGQVKYKGSPVDSRVELEPTGKASLLWLITMPEPVR